MITTRDKATSYLFRLASLLNHDCKANSKLTSTRRIRMKVIAIRDIRVSDEITVFYSEDYFGNDNRKCLCKTCEIHCRNGWVLEDQRGFH
jgi:histone-lysine N-methyltransferase SUV420H